MQIEVEATRTRVVSNIGIASAPSWKGPYTRLSNDPILPKVTAEDPSMYERDL